MKPGEFKVKSVNSGDLGIYIQTRPTILAPARRIEFMRSYQSDGDLVYDEETYEDTSTILSLAVSNTQYKDANESVRRAKIRRAVHDLFKGGSYIPFEPYFDESVTYYVILNGSLEFANKHYIGDHYICTLPLRIKPYKMLKNYNERTITNGAVLTNPSTEVARPIIKITGSGNITLTVGGKAFQMKGVSTSIILDCELEQAYKESGGVITSNENNKVITPTFPVLNVGKTTISWSGGTVTQVKIIERWRVLV